MLGFIALVLLSLAQIAIGQELVDAGTGSALAPVVAPDMFVERSFFDTLLSGDFVAKLIPLVVGVQLILLGVASGLTRISVITENKWDNKLAGWLSEAAWVAGVLIGKFGYGTPKLVLEEKAKDAVAAAEKPK